MELQVNLTHLKERAQRAYKEAKYSKALTEIEKYLENVDRDAEAEFLRANILHIQGKIGKAIKAFKRVLELNSDHTDAMISLSVLLNDIGKYTEAQSYFELADRKVKKGDNGVIDNHINRKFSGHHFEIAEMYFSYGRFDEALIEYQKAYNLDKTNLEIRIKIAKVYSKKGFFSKAREELLKLKNEHPAHLPTRLALGLHFYSRGKIIEAQSEWNSILHKNPAHKEARMYLTLSKAATEVSLD